MKPEVIVSLFFLSVLFYASLNEACLKKIRTLIRNRGKEAEKPAELYKEESSYIQYAHARSSNFYIELIHNEDNNSYSVRELEEPLVAMSQVQIPAYYDEDDEDDLEANEENRNPKFSPVTVDSSTKVAIPSSPPSSASPPPLQKSGTGNKKEGGEEEEEEILSPDDENVRKDWGGSCTTIHWNRCNTIRHLFKLEVINTTFQKANWDLDCLLEPILCLKNGWTANRCHILCMAAECNKGKFFEWDETVDFEGPCRYRK